MLPSTVVGDGVAVGVGVRVGVGVDVGLGVGVGVGLGDGVEFTTVTVPTMLQHRPCGVQKYGNVPTALKVWVKTAPWIRTPEFHSPFAIPGVPEVLLWKSSPQVHRTVSPG
jgi:hypothetical protein